MDDFIKCKYCGKQASRYNKKVFCSQLCGDRYSARGYSRAKLLLMKNMDTILSNRNNKMLFELLTK